MNSKIEEVDKILECPICLDVYDKPKLLPCQHTICYSCITNLVVNDQIICPECRSVHKITSQGAATLPTSIIIQRFLDLNLTNIKQKCFKCSQRRDNTSTCVECNKLFCSDCKRDHCFVLKNEMKDNMKNLQMNILPQLNKKVEYYKRENEVIINKYDSMKENVTSTINEIVNELKIREQSLHAELNGFMSSELEMNNSNREDVEIEIASVGSFCDDIQLYIERDDNQYTNQIPQQRKQFEEFITKMKGFDKENTQTNKVIHFNLIVFLFKF
jgi:hypothetical protein